MHCGCVRCISTAFSLNFCCVSQNVLMYIAVSIITIYSASAIMARSPKTPNQHMPGCFAKARREKREETKEELVC